jgi:hypothetical protein
MAKTAKTARYRRHDGLTPADAAKQYSVKQARPPKRDESAAIELAKLYGADVADVVELWHERAAIRSYEANDSVEDAEVGALTDVRSILEAAKWFLIGFSNSGRGFNGDNYDTSKHPALESILLAEFSRVYDED